MLESYGSDFEFHKNFRDVTMTPRQMLLCGTEKHREFLRGMPAE